MKMEQLYIMHNNANNKIRITKISTESDFHSSEKFSKIGHIGKIPFHNGQKQSIK